MLVALLQGQKHMMRGLYLVGLPLTMQYIYIYEKLLAKFEPELSAHLAELCVPTTSYTSKWFMTIFASMPFEFMIRVWDAFVSEGPKVLFRVAVAIMRLVKPEVLQMSDEAFQKFMKDELPERLDPDVVIPIAFKLSLSRDDISKLAQQYEKEMSM
jgi:hypothetical protein